MTKEYILEFLKNHKEEFRNKYQVEKIGLFGSYARNEAREDSDIDILVEMPSSFDNFFDLKYFLEDSLGKNVDLGKLKNLRLLVKQYVDKEIVYV